MADTWQVNIYKINNDTKVTKEVCEKLNQVNTTEASESEPYIDRQKILKQLLKTDGSKYTPQSLNEQVKNNFELHLFYRKSLKMKPDWKDFLSNVVQDGQKLLDDVKSYHESFILFMYEITSQNLYAICGGYAFFTIQDYVEDSFGLDVLSRIVDSKNEKIISQSKELGVTGGILGTTKHFRQTFNFHENDNFGNVYREITTYLSKETVERVGLNIGTNSNALCLAKSSFRINKSITLESLMHIVKKCDHIIENEEPRISVNNIKLIDSKKDKLLVETLNDLLLEYLWTQKSNPKLGDDIDVAHKDFDSFLSATKYKFNTKKLDSKYTLLIDILESIKTLGKEKYVSRVKNAEFISYNEDGDELTKGKFLDHLILELVHDGSNYFFINGKWFVITSNFIAELNETCKDFIANNYNSKLDKRWDTSSTPKEGEYNLLYKNDMNTIVLDTITPEGIEPCDILKYDDDSIYLFHVKKGFNGSMRDLCSQVFVSANRIIQDIKSNDFTYLRKVHEKMQASQKYSGQINDLDAFLGLFMKKIVFVLAVYDDAEHERTISSIETFQSNVAKFSLKELIEKMKSKGFAFEVTQIRQGV